MKEVQYTIQLWTISIKQRRIALQDDIPVEKAFLEVISNPTKRTSNKRRTETYLASDYHDRRKNQRNIQNKIKRKGNLTKSTLTWSTA